MDHEILALALTFLVHVLGVAALVWHLLRNEDERPDWGGWFRDDDDPRPPAGPDAVPPEGALPLPDAAPSGVRLREPGRLADARPGPARRPEHAPERAPQRERPAAPPR